jgi:hypothetical protein
LEQAGRKPAFFFVLSLTAVTPVLAHPMVRSGYYNGVPLYSDTTIEAYSIVYVPVQRGRMRPYERLRQGALAGTVASRTSSFPVRIATSTAVMAQAAAAGLAAPYQLKQ